MKTIALLTGILISVIFISCNQNSKSNDTSVLNSQAQFPGGYEALQKYIRKNLDWKEPKEDTVESYLPVILTIKENGDVSDIELRYSLCESCDSAAMQLAGGMPKWIPARKDGKEVESKAMIHIMFQSSSIK